MQKLTELERVDPWTRQKELQKKYAYEEVPDLDELNSIIEDIKLGKIDVIRQTKRARALFAMYYLTACRLSEIIKVSKLWKSKYKRVGSKYKLVERAAVPHDYSGILKRDIKFETDHGKPCMNVRTENRKHGDRKTKKQPIPIELEMSIVKFVKDYIKHLNPNDVLFNFGVKRATQIITETTGFNIHFIRHIRATHLVTKYDFNEQALIKFMGWTDARPAKHYMELTSSDVFMQFYKRR